MLDKHEISSKSTRGKKLIIEARKRSFPVVQQRMHDFPDKEHSSGDIHHEERLVEEVSLQIDSHPNIPPNSSPEEDYT